MTSTKRSTALIRAREVDVCMFTLTADKRPAVQGTKHLGLFGMLCKRMAVQGFDFVLELWPLMLSARQRCMQIPIKANIPC